MRRNSDAIGSWTRLKWLGTSEPRSGGKAGLHVTRAPLFRAVAVLNRRPARDVHTRMSSVHESGLRVDGMGIDLVGKAVSRRVTHAQHQRRAAPA